MYYRTSGWNGFCGGNILRHFSNSGDSYKLHAEGVTAIERLISIADTIEEASFVMADSEYGVADKNIFSGLDSEGKIEAGDNYSLRYTLSPFFFNPNSGNMCRVLFVWKEYTEAFMEERREELEGNDDDEPQDYEEDYDDE